MLSLCRYSENRSLYFYHAIVLQVFLDGKPIVYDKHNPPPYSDDYKQAYSNILVPEEVWNTEEGRKFHIEQALDQLEKITGSRTIYRITEWRKVKWDDLTQTYFPVRFDEQSDPDSLGWGQGTTTE